MSFLCAVTPLYGWQGRVVQVIDGDTMVVMKGEESVNVRLYGIDCPEGNQASGREAWIFASKLADGNPVEVQPIDIDRYGRTVATVHVNGRSINEELIRSGHAWVYTQYCTNDFCRDWLKLQSDSQGARSGLWAAKNPTPPWDFRHSFKLAQATPQSSKPKAPPASAASYHGNISSRIFHDSSCQHYDCKACTATFTTRQQALDAGYRPCKKCGAK